MAVYFCQTYWFQPDIIPTGSITRKQDNTAMVPGPANFISRHATFIEQRGAAARQHRYYIKWLHYHLDSCHEYNLIHTEDESLSDLTGKLKEKKTAENFRKQGHHALSFLWTEALLRQKNEQHLQWQPIASGRIPLEYSFCLHLTRDD